MQIEPIIKFQELLKYKNLGIQINYKYADKIRKLIRLKFGSYEKSFMYIGRGAISNIRKRSIKVFNWIKIFGILNIDLNEFEKNIIKITDKKDYNITFPYKISPLLIRLVAHLVGDGGYYKYNARWIQKDVKPVINLQKQILGVSANKIKGAVEQVTIMNFYTKLACAVLGIERNELGSSHFIERCMSLPREYNVQVIAAILEDESRIESKSGSIRIAMKNYNIINSLAKLMDTLGYERGDIVKIKNKGFKSDEDSFLFSLHLRVLGAHKFYDDLGVAINNYGRLAGLWKKQKQLRKLILLNNGKKAKGNNINKQLSKRVIDLMRGENGVVSYKELKQSLGTSHHRTGSVIRRLFNKKIIDKSERGVYRLLPTFDYI